MPIPHTIKLTLCGTGILPVLDDCKQLQKNRVFVGWASCVPDGQDAHPTIKQTLCGTGILPVLGNRK